MKAIVHIGTEKTGTTSIQTFLFQNRMALKDAGFHFLQSAGATNNRALPAYFVSDDAYDDFLNVRGISTPEGRAKFRANFLRKFESELESLPRSIHTVIISSEHFHSRIKTEEGISNVQKLLSTYFDSIKIVCYLREQGTTCTSLYSTALRSGQLKSFPDFLRGCRPQNIYYNYNEMLANWEAFFGLESMDVSLFEPNRFVNQELLDDFTAKISPQLIGKLDTSVKIENESLRPVGQALARAVNLAFPVRTSGSEILVVRKRLQETIYREFRGRGLQPTLSMKKEIFESFVESNEELRLRYFSDVEVLFDEPKKDVSSDRDIDDNFLEVLINILGLVKKVGAGIIQEEEYSAIYAHILSCVNDITADENRKVGKEFIFDKNDALLFKNAAFSIGKRDLGTAARLMSLAGKILHSPPILERFEEYSNRADLEELEGYSDRAEDRTNKRQYLITYHYESEDEGAYHKSVLGPDFQAWMLSLSVPVPGIFNPLKDHRNIGRDGVVSTSPTSYSARAFTIFEADSMEKAIEIALECPCLAAGGVLELTELMQLIPNVSQI